MAMTSLKWPDYLILTAFLLISLGIGFYHSMTGGRQRTTQEFIMANRKLGILPTAISMFVSFQSAIMMLGLTSEMYQYGIQYLIWIPVGFACAIVTTERLVVPWIYPLKLTSINDYLEQRFQSKAVRILGAVNAILSANFYMGVAMYAPSAALEAATGLPVAVSIPLMAVVSIAYTALGGMRAVIWTDVFQFVTMIGGLLAVMIQGLIIAGGFSEVTDICRREGRLEFANWSLDPTVRHTVWGMVVGWTFSWTLIYGFNQAAVQRYAATATMQKARIVLLLNIPAIALITFVVCFIGLTVYAFYSKLGCDPVLNGDVSGHNQLLSLFVTTIFAKSQGFSGLFLATLYGGALSSVSSSLSGCAANCWDDILKWKLDGMKENKKALLNRLLVVIFGVIATIIAFLASVVPGTITQVSITFASMVNGPMLGMFLMGGVSRHANYKGALVGGLVGLILSCWLVMGSFSLNVRHPTLPPASVDGCPVHDLMLSNNISRWVTEDSINIVDSMTSSIALYAEPINSTVSIRSHQFISDLSGIQRFYALSYLWYTMFGTINTVVIGMVISFIFRDREAEAKIDGRLLIPYRKVLSWSETSLKSITLERDQQNDVIDIDINSNIPEEQMLYLSSEDAGIKIIHDHRASATAKSSRLLTSSA